MYETGSIQTEIHLNGRGEFRIMKNGEIAIVGNWYSAGEKQLTLVSGIYFWTLESKTMSPNLLTLNFSGYYQFMRDLRITLVTS